MSARFSLRFFRLKSSGTLFLISLVVPHQFTFFSVTLSTKSWEETKLSMYSLRFNPCAYCCSTGSCHVLCSALVLYLHVVGVASRIIHFDNSVFLAYFPKMKVGLSNPLSVCPPPHLQLLLNRMVDFHNIWYGGDDTEGDLDATILIPQIQP
jgi:hypothetical protein